MKKLLERKYESRLKKKKTRKYEGQRYNRNERGNVRVSGEGEREKAKENFQKKKGREQAEMTLAYSKLNILTVIKNNSLYTE